MYVQGNCMQHDWTARILRVGSGPTIGKQLAALRDIVARAHIIIMIMEYCAQGTAYLRFRHFVQRFK